MQALGCGLLLQAGDGVIMAGVQGQHMHVGVEGRGKGALQVGAQGLNLRGQSRLGLALGPHELAAKLGQARRLAFLPDDQFIAKLLFPALEGAPDMAIGQAQLPR